MAKKPKLTREQISARAAERRQLKQEIRELTQKVNVNIYEYRQQGKSSKPMEAAIKRMQQFGGKANPIKQPAAEIGYGFNRRRTLEDLRRQKAELERVQNKDVWTPAGMRRMNDYANKSWLSFSKRHPDMTKEDWQTFVDTFGAMNSELKEVFGYIEKRSGVSASDVGNEALVAAYEQGSRDKRTNILLYMQQVVEEHKGEGMSQKDAIMYLKEKLKDDGEL